WHWAFLAQPEPFPQTMINAVTPQWFLTNRGGIPRQRPKIVMDEFIGCFTPKTISGACRDYRAGATINFEMDAADKDKKIATPLDIGDALLPADYCQRTTASGDCRLCPAGAERSSFGNAIFHWAPMLYVPKQNKRAKSRTSSLGSWQRKLVRPWQKTPSDLGFVYQQFR